jgi:site-specific DNA-cytosine methylase
MAERPLYTLYKNLKAQNYDVPDDYNKFESALTRDGKGGADNRHAIYENLKAQNFDVPSTYERFYSALFEPRSKTSSRAKGGSVPMSAADRARFSAGSAAISASAQQTMNNAGRYNRLKQRKQKQQKDFGRVNLGTHQTPYGGDANNVVKDDFAYNPETGKTGAYVTSDNENVYSLPEAEQKQAILDQQNNAYQEAVDTGEIPSAFDVRDKKGNYDLQENIGKNGTYLTEEGAQKQFDKKLADAYARKKEIEALIAEDNRQHGNPLLSYGASIGASNGRTAEQSDYRNKLATSLSLVTEQIGALEAVKQYPTSSWGEDALKALDNTAFTAKTWDFGLTDFAIMGQMERIKTKMDNNIPLSGSDKMLLKSKLGADAATALEDEKMGNVYRWTKIAGQSLPFMADFFLTGGYGGITKGISRGALKFAAKRGMGKVGAAILKNTGIVAGDVIGSYAMAGTEQALKTGADIMQRHLGNLYQDEKGDYKFGTFDENGNLLHEGGESIGTALYKGMTSAMVENYTEKLFGHNYGIKKGAVNFMEKHGMNASAEFFKNIGKSGWYTNSKKWMEKFGINGFAEEVMEEEIGIPLHALLDGEGKVSDLLDAKQQLDIIGGMAISVGSMYAMGAGSRPVKGIYNRAQYYRFRNKVNVADSDAQNLMGDNWADIKDKIDNATNEQMGGVLSDILRQRDTMTKEQINAAVNYGVNLMKMRGYNIAKTAEMNAKEITNEPTTPEEQHQADIDNAYSEGYDADDADKHDIQIQQEDQMKTLAAALGISEQQLSAMSDEELESMTGQDDKLDQAIYDYQLSSARYQGVVDDAQDKVDLAAHQAEQRVDMYTDQSRGSVRNATIKASGGLEDYGVYIISGNIASHEDGSIDVSNSDDMILYYDPTTNSVEHADALMFAELGEELPADEVKAQAVSDAKENAIKEIAGIIDGTVEVGSQFSVTDADGTEHTYEVLADYGDGTAAISIDGNVVENPYQLADLQQMKDLEDQKRLQAAKVEREQMEKERAAQQTQETEQSQPSFDFNQILNDDGNVVLVDVLDKDGNTKYPDSRLFLIRDTGAKAKVVELKSDGTIVPHAVNKEDVATISSMSLDEYKQAMPESSMIEGNGGENRGEIEVETPTIDGETAAPTEETAAPESAETPETEQTPAAPAITLEDGTIVPMLEDGNPDFSKLTAAQTAELYDNQFGEDADSIVSGYVSDAKKALDKASNMTVKGKTFVEQKAAKDAKEKAIADAKAAYDSAIAIRDAYNERQLAKVEDTAEGRKELIEKARRKFARLKSAVKDDAEAVAQIYKETVGTLLHRLYDGTGIDVTDTIPLTAEEYVASNLGAHSLNYEGTETSKGVKQETGLSREDFAKTQLLAADGKGTTIDALVHSLWENRPSNLESLDTQDIRNALIGVLNSGFKASEARNFVENIRIAQAENILEEQKRAQENAAYAEQHKAEPEAELKAKSDEKAELKAKSEEKLDNESSNESNDLDNDLDNEKTNDKINDNINVPEDATDENPLGAERDESDLPFSSKENGKQQTTAERAADVEKNKVDDMKVVDNIVGEKTRKSFERLAKMMGANIQWQYSDKLGNGWIQETTDADGNVHRTIFITLDSSITEGAQFIFGHEMTHQIKNLNPAAYNELTQLVLDTYGSDAFDKAVDETMKRYSNAGFSGRARDYYAEEVVADAVGEMIRDLNLAHTLAMKMSHPLLAAIHEILQKIKLAFFGTEYSDVTKNIIRSIEQAYVKTANGEVTNSETGEDVSFSLRQKPEPKKKGVGYKVFVLKDGKLYPPMVANPDGAATPVGVWLDADAAPIAGESKTGRPQVKQGGKGTQGGSGKLAYRPGWHLGVVPYAIQFNRKDAEGNKTLFPKNFVFAEVEYAADVDYQDEARQEGINPSGKYQHSLAGLKHLPTDGYYMYRTNPNPETDPWVITGAMKVKSILTRAEQADLVSKAGREPQQIQEGDIVTDDVVNSINQEIADAPKFSLKVYHGSGADFTEFDFDHMGEGAGSQVFGWGGYVTSSKKIGKSYANLVDANAPHQDVEYVGNNAHEYTDVVAGLFNGGQRDYDDVKEFLQNGYNSDKDNARKKQMLEWFESTKPSDWKSVNDGKRNLYEVNIPEDNGSNYLEWEKTLTEKQINAIRDALAKNGVDISSFEKRGFKLDLPFKYVYTTVLPMMMHSKPKDVSKFLSSLGFTGIKYPAGTIMGGAEEGDTNYVIFKPEDMKITQHTKFSLKSKPVRFETGKKLSDEEKKEVLSTLKDAYKVNGVPYHIEETAGGKEKRVYEPTADSYVVSDITNRPLRYYITLPDGRVAHPTEVYPNISDNEVKSSATKQGLLDDEADHIVSAAIGNMKGIADNAKGGSPRLVRGEVKKRFDEVTKQIKQLRAEGKEDEAKALIEKNRGLYNAYQKNDDFNSYKSLAGEVEARNVSARLNMTPEERRKTLAESTEDVARKDQIFLGVGDVSFSLHDMADGKESGAADMAEDLKSLNTPDEVDDAIKTAIDDMPSGWQMANKKMVHIAQALGENRKAEIAGEEPKFSLKDGTLIKAGTYFSGGGLVEEGLKGIIDPVVAVEYDEKISGVYRNNFGQHIVTADVRDVDPKELVKQIDGDVEYFHASPVCKNYSQAKSNHAEVELDKETAASTAEFINAIKPKVVTIENVKGYKDSEAMKTITDALDANGYTWDADVYNAADYGGYTNRERLIVRAVRDGKLPEKPKKIAHKSGWYEAVADIIPTLTEKKNGVAPWMDIRLKADGIDWRNIDKPLYVMGSAYADGKVPHAFADELLPTLRTKSGDVIVMPDGKVYRAMGRVLARVSGVSDDYKMPFSESLSHTIIGNGIPTQLTEHVIAPLLTGSDPKFSIRTYHGTGASFDKFDLSHALEGEGSETFGHGVYVTNSSKIGREYAQRAKQRKMADLYKNMRYPDGVKDDIFKRRVFGEMVNDVATGGSVASAKEFAKKRVGADANDIQRTLENLKDREKGTEYEQNLKDRLAEYKDALKWIDSIDEDYLTQGNANRYDVDIPDDNGNYLGWNDSQNFPLEKWYRLWEITHHGFNENEYFKDGGARYDKDRIERIIQMKLDSPENGMQRLSTLKGEELYHALEDFFDRERPSYGAELASRALSEIGFVGIKYPAGLIHGGAEEGDYNYVIFDENNANIVGNTRFSLRYDQFEHDLNQWKKDNNLPKDAQRPTIPQRNAGESAVDFLRRVDEYRKQMALWKTAPTYEQHLLSDDTAIGEFNRELQRGSVLKRIAFQDSMLAIRKAQEAIMKEVGVDRLNMAEDAYTAENRSHGKGKNEFEEYNNEFLQPLRKAYHQMKKVLGDSYDNVRIYMMAKHGLERDAQMAFKKSLDADFEDVAQRSAAYKAYKGDMNRIINDSDLEFGRVDFNTWRQRDNALRTKYSPSYMDYRYDENGIVSDYSGLSQLLGGSDFEEAAYKLVKDIEDKYVTETHNLWDATNAATKKILRDGYKAGMMSKDTYQYVRDMYSHYIPLRGWDGTTADQVWDYIGGGKGAFNQTLKKAHGRTSIADDPIAYIENMAESGILLNNKNWVKQHLMLLAQNHPTSLLTLSKAWYVKSTDANGNEEWIPATPQISSQMNSNQVKAAIDAFEKKMEQMAQTGDATQKRDGLNIAYPQTHSEEREHEVRVMKDGEEYVIYVNGDPQLAQAMNNTRAHRVREIQSGKLDRAAAWLGRKMAAAYTSLSPLFIPSNYFRDLTMTLASTAIREDAKYNYLLRKNLATSWNLGSMLRDFQNGKLRDKVNNGNATPKEQMFYDFMMNGGETGFVSSLDVEDLKKKFKNDLKDLDRWKANPVKVGHTIMDSIEFLNRAIEDSNRFAVYMTSIQYGRSIDEAVNDAKNVTLNFNRKGTGEYGWQMIRNLYLFINPAVQSLQTLGALAKHHPFKFTAVTASWLASGVLVPIVNAALMSMLGGDDDKDKYWQFTKWDRRNNLIMWVPFTHEYVKIPLAQEFRAFYGIGDMIASKMMGGELAEESWSQYAEDLLGQVVDMLPLDPTGYDGNIAVSLMPNAIRPVFELAFNVDFTGKPLFKDTEYNKYDPNFTKAYVGTPDWLVRASRMVNSIGNDYPDVQQNSIDAFGDPRYNLNNPAVVDHVLSSYLGGAYTMGSQVLGLLTKSLNDPKEIKVADIPLFSKFVSNPDDRPVTKKQGDEFWNMKENHDRAANTLSKLKKQAKVDGDYSMLERFYGSEEYKKYKQDDVKVKKYEEDKKKERAEESGEEYRPHKLNAEDIYKAHATPKDDFEDLKLKQLYTKLNGFKTSYDLLVDTAPSQSDGYYNNNKAAIDAIDEISLDKQEISELKKGFLDDGKDAYNAEDMKQIRDLRKKILSVLEKANKVVVANQKAKAKK